MATPRFGLRRAPITKFAAVAVPASRMIDGGGWTTEDATDSSALCRPTSAHGPFACSRDRSRFEAIAEVPDGPPARFRWRRVLHEVAVAERPERIAIVARRPRR